MASRLNVVKIAYDSDAGVWFVDHSTLPGLAAEAASADALIARIPAMIADLIEENGLRANETLKQAGLPKAF